VWAPMKPAAPVVRIFIFIFSGNLVNVRVVYFSNKQSTILRITNTNHLERINLIQRENYLDIAKGISILTVVLYHTLEGIENSFGVSETTSLIITYINIGLMPIFFFISGYLARHSLNNPSKTKEKLIYLSYLYIIWSIIIYVVRLFSANVANSPIEASEILHIFWDPLPTIWFIYCLMLCTLITFLLRNNLMLLLLIAVTAHVLNFLYPGWASDSIFQRVAWLLVFFGFGLRFGEVFLEYLKSHFKIIGIASVLILSLAVYHELETTPLRGVLSFVWIALLIGISYEYLKFLSPLFLQLGIISLTIYLIHFPFPAFFRIVLLKLDSYSLVLHSCRL
jgi:fucose 4-O-acetylase-like acetyltransferase